MAKKNNQVTGNAGLFYVSYLLSRLEWNVLPTSRNARGVDALIYSETGDQTKSVQIKTLSKLNPAGLGKNIDHLIADWLAVCMLGRDVSDPPRCFVLRKNEVKAHKTDAKKSKGGVSQYFLQPKDYKKHEDPLLSRIGSGNDLPN